MTKEIDFSAFSPTDYRYAVDALRAYLSEEAYVRYKAKIEAALAQVFEKRGIVKKEIGDEIVAATSSITVEGVCEEDKTLIRLLRNSMRLRMMRWRR